MASTNHTPNFSLPQWVATDPVLMADFNSAFSAIDTALAGRTRIVTGTYTGSGECGASHPNTLSFAFPPKLVLLQSPEGGFPAVLISGGSFTNTANSYGLGSTQWGAIRYTISGNGVSWYNDGTYVGGDGSGQTSPNAERQLNKSGLTYSYLAIG